MQVAPMKRKPAQPRVRHTVATRMLHTALRTRTWTTPARWHVASRGCARRPSVMSMRAPGGLCENAVQTIVQAHRQARQRARLRLHQTPVALLHALSGKNLESTWAKQPHSRHHHQQEQQQQQQAWNQRQHQQHQRQPWPVAIHLLIRLSTYSPVNLKLATAQQLQPCQLRRCPHQPKLCLANRARYCAQPPTLMIQYRLRAKRENAVGSDVVLATAERKMRAAQATQPAPRSETKAFSMPIANRLIAARPPLPITNQPIATPPLLTRPAVAVHFHAAHRQHCFAMVCSGIM
mmetsp:Transcript_40431/g.120608  ORF Transcript_40431/g.120608 Transcript_40431/m.120608 type:complete len:292 (+) Transcript_40431:3023-3898(+)